MNKVAEFVIKGESFKLIMQTLNDQGYGVEVWCNPKKELTYGQREYRLRVYENVKEEENATGDK